MKKSNQTKFTKALVQKYGIFALELFIKRKLGRQDFSVSLKNDYADIQFGDKSEFNLTDYHCIKVSEVGDEDYAQEIECKYRDYLTKFGGAKYKIGLQITKMKDSMCKKAPLEKEKTR